MQCLFLREKSTVYEIFLMGQLLNGLSSKKIFSKKKKQLIFSLSGNRALCNHMYYVVHTFVIPLFFSIFRVLCDCVGTELVRYAIRSIHRGVGPVVGGVTQATRTPRFLNSFF